VAARQPGPDHRVIDTLVGVAARQPGPDHRVIDTLVGVAARQAKLWPRVSPALITG